MDLRVTDDLVIPSGELHWRFTTSGGPGGQHANRSATRAELSFDVATSAAMPKELRQRIIARLGSPSLVVVVDESRSQWRNRQLARARLASKLKAAMTEPSRRVATKPSRASKRRRLDAKRHRSEIKRGRRKPERD